MGRRGFKATHKARVGCRYAEFDDRCKAHRTGRDWGWQFQLAEAACCFGPATGVNCFLRPRGPERDGCQRHRQGRLVRSREASGVDGDSPAETRPAYFAMMC